MQFLPLGEPKFAAPVAHAQVALAVGQLMDGLAWSHSRHKNRVKLAVVVPAGDLIEVSSNGWPGVV